MKFFIIFILFIGIQSLLAKEYDFSEAKVTELTTNSIDNFLRVTPKSIVYYYSGSKECEKFMNTFLKVATTYHEDGNNEITFAALDVEKHITAKTKYNIETVPTVIYYTKNLEVSEFILPKTKPNFEKFIENPHTPIQLGFGPSSWGIESSVYHLTDRNFTSFLKSHPYVLMMFYIPGCGHCKNMKPDYSEASTIVINEKKGEFAAINCESAQKSCEKYKVEGFPTLMLFRDSQAPIQYPGDRSKDDLLDFFYKNSPSINIGKNTGNKNVKNEL